MTMAENMFEREAIKNLQKYLRQLSYHNDEISPLPIDGIWDSATERALSSFQSLYNLPVTGRADRITWDILKREYDRSLSENSPPAPLLIFPRIKGYAVSEGDDGILAQVIIYMLDELSAVYGFPIDPESGSFDSHTSALISDFQYRNGLPQSGRVDRETWDRLAAEYNLLGGKYN